MMRRSNNNLHYFINGLDQGVAASKVPENVWGVIDLYGMTIKVGSTIIWCHKQFKYFFIITKSSLLIVVKIVCTKL